MTYNQSSGNLNKNVLVNRLNLIQDKNTVFFENDDYIVLSPSIQNDSWWFDLLRGNVKKVQNSPKDGFLILRFFEKLLIAPLKDFMHKMIKEEFVVKRQQGQDNWKFNVRRKNDRYIIINQKNSTFEYSVQLVTEDELVLLVQQQNQLNEKNEVKKLINEYSYREWLRDNTALASKTIGAYISAIRSLKEPLKQYSHFQNELDLFQIYDINTLNLIMNDDKFLILDEKWNRAHTSALNYYKKYLSDLGVLNENIEINDDFESLNLNGNISFHIHSYISSKGFIYAEANIKNLYLSLRSKPFVIISGISGTGKTKIVQLFAEAIGATEENKQFKLVPVRPDWSDSSDLIGYTDLTGKFKEGPFTEMVKQAHNNPDLPHFVLLDEMNLARVEYYFSDVLSVMESRREDDNGEIISSPLTIIDDKPLTLPNNLYVLGTVNMDETTHPFSKKVLDRANSIEFNEIHLDNFSFENIEVESKVIGNSQIQSTYLYLKHAYRGNEKLIKNVTEKIVEFNKLLQPINAHVGYRVRDEICFYMIYNNQMQFLDEDQAFDFCIMQKILPRIAGSGQRVQQLLEDLFEKLAGQKFDQDTDVPQSAAYLLSAKKVAEMLRRLADDGFTSFWIS